jgi:hypothetical protein
MTDRTSFATKSEHKKTSRNSYQVSHLHMLHDTVRLAQPDRRTEEVVAQKETTESAIRSIDFVLRNQRVSSRMFFVVTRRELL